MSFKEWLPITMRNRVALALAALALPLFVVWNCLPVYFFRNELALREERSRPPVN